MESRERVPEGEALRRLARQMAAVSDTTELLAILCDAAATQCNADGAAVVKAEEDAGVIVSACGFLVPALSKRFSLRGSLLREMLRTNDIVGVHDLSAIASPLTPVVPGVHVGPMLVAPLMAHESMIGGLAIGRSRNSKPFTDEERERLRLIS